MESSTLACEFNLAPAISLSLPLSLSLSPCVAFEEQMSEQQRFKKFLFIFLGGLKWAHTCRQISSGSRADDGANVSEEKSQFLNPASAFSLLLFLMDVGG